MAGLVEQFARSSESLSASGVAIVFEPACEGVVAYQGAVPIGCQRFIVMDVPGAVHAEAVTSDRTHEIARSADGDIITGGVKCSDKSGVARNGDRAGGPNANKVGVKSGAA